jgi:hypothetical protein
MLNRCIITPLLVLAFLLYSISSLAQDNSGGSQSETAIYDVGSPRTAAELLNGNEAHSNQVGYQQPTHSTLEIVFCIGILVFGAFIISLEVYVMLVQKRYWDVWSFKIVGLTLVVVCGMFLVVAGYDQNQIAPMMALLGTVAGYMLGKESGLPSQLLPQQEKVA